jgi:glucose/arabinose dehydrogenase
MRKLIPLGAVAYLTMSHALFAQEQLNTEPMSVATVLAFPNIEWQGWEGVTPEGEVNDFRPIVLTHAGDGSNRVFVGTQQGIIHVFPNKDEVSASQVYLDMSKKVRYHAKENEEGFLGFAFHPKYKENGEFFVYYTTTDTPHTSVISRFRVSKEDPQKADPEFEEEIFRLKQPFWNHNGGTIIFGPDGYLYIALGDGGAANDPFGHGQNTKTLLGSILRINVDRKSDDKTYGIPGDNPFASNPDKGQPEIYAWGLRNVWRMAFDSKTNHLWAGDVGQDLWEEIDIIVKGGNYGWNLREGMHKFGANGSEPREDLIDPIWEYHHTIEKHGVVGKSITGGNVYRGKQIPVLDGYYLYADYVSGKVFALKYDFDRKLVVENRPIPSPQMLALSFGEDELGETYVLTATITGKGIFRLAPK